MDAPQATTYAGEIKQVAVLDLTGLTSPDDLTAVTRITRVAVILVPEALLSALMRIPMEQIASIVPVPAGKNLKIMAGQAQMSGDALANPGGGPDDVLIVAGQLVITTPVQQVGYGQLIVAGQVLAPTGSETALGAGITRQTGQVIYYPPDARFFIGKDRFAGAFFEFLDQPITMVLVGNFALEADVSADLLRAKVPRIMLFGQVTAPRALVPLLQVLTTEKYGDIVAGGDE